MIPYSPPAPAPRERVSRTIAVREDQTLEQLHEAVRLAFGWADPHLYSYWTSGKFWDSEGEEYTAPFGIDEMGKAKRSARDDATTLTSTVLGNPMTTTVTHTGLSIVRSREGIKAVR